MNYRSVVPLLAVLLLACSQSDVSEQRSTLRLGGSGGARDVVEKLLATFQSEHPDLDIHHPPSTHSGTALRALQEGELDLAYLTRRPTDAERAGLYLYPFAYDPLVFAVHRGCGVSALSTNQLRDLYRGTLDNWSQLGGADLPVVLLDRPEHTSPKVVLRRALFANLEVDPEALVLERPGAMDEALQTYSGALGYTSLRAAMGHGDLVDVLRLDGVYPSIEEVSTGAYPHRRAMLFAARDPLPKPVKEWFQHIESATGHITIEAMALVPTRRELRIGVPPMRNIVSLEVKYGALARYLAERLGRPVELVHSPSYTDLTEAFRKNRIDGAFVGSFAYLIAHLEADVEALARPEHRGISHYRGGLYVRSEAPYQKVEELRGARVAHSGKATTAGEIYPIYALRTRKLPPPNEFFAQYVEAGSHENALRLLLDGKVDAAAAKDLVFLDMVDEEPKLADRIRLLDASPPVPSNAFAAGPLLDEVLKQQIRGLLLSIDQSPRGRKALSDMGASRFLATSDADYANLHLMIEVVAADLAEYFQYR